MWIKLCAVCAAAMIVRADVTFNQQGSRPRGKPGKIYDHTALTIQVIGHQARLTGAEVSFGSRPCKNAYRCYDSLAGSSGDVMKRFIQGADRQQTTLLPECLDVRRHRIGASYS